jgi:hypothetical protein
MASVGEIDVINMEQVLRSQISDIKAKIPAVSKFVE